MKKLPLGRQIFEEIRSEELLYVDKTRYIYDILTGTGAKRYDGPFKAAKKVGMAIDDKKGQIVEWVE
jgi:hypothetical protein